MAGPVKGNIGQEEVVLNDAATESTLLKLLAAMEKGGGGSGGAGGGGSNPQQNLMDLAKQTGKTTKELDDFEESVDKAGNSLTRGFGHVFQGLQGMATEFMSGSTRLSEFSGHIAGVASNLPIIGGALGGTFQLLTSIMDNSIDSFRELSNIGVDFGGGLMENRLAAARAGLSLDTFNEVISNNSESLALLGGSATAGARAFTRVSGEVQKNQATFSRLGITMEDTAAYTADYLAMQTSLGRAQRMTTAQQAAGASNLIMEIDKLAKVTGKQRDQIAKDMQANMSDKRVKLLFNTMDEAAQANLNGVMTMMGDASPGLKDAITEMVATGGVPLNAMGQDLIRLNPKLGEMSEGLKNGTVTQEQFMAEIRRSAEMADGLSDAQKEQYSTLAAMGSEVGGAVIEIIGLKNAGKGLAEVTAAQAAATENRDRELLNFEKAIQNVKNAIMDTLINTGIFDVFQSAISSLVGSGEGQGISGLQAAIAPVADWFKKFFGDLAESEDPMATIKIYLKEGLSKLGEMVKPLIASAFSGLGSMIMSAIFGGGSSEESSGGGGGGGPAADSGSGDSSTGWFSSITGALGTFGTMLAAGSAVFIAVKGFQKLLAGFAAPQVAIGTAVLTGLLIGTGAAIKLAGDGISSAGDGVNKIAAGLERMGNIQGADNIKDLGSALGDMGTAMLSLGAGNILDSITSFFGASSPFDKMVEGINTFQNVDPAALASMTSSSGALQGLKSFADDIDSSKVEDFAEAIEGLADSMEKLNEEYSSTKGFFGGGGPGSQEILSAISSGTSQGSAGVNSSIGELITLMKENNKISKQILDATGDGV